MKQVTKASLDSFDDEEHSATFCISSPRVDRDQDVVNLTTESFKEWADAGAPWHLGHDHSSGIGIGTSIDPQTGKLEVWRHDGKWYAKCFFTDLSDPDSLRAYRALKTGRSGAASVAFLPEQWDDRSGGGHEFKRVSISEISVVSVPACPECVVQEVKSWQVKEQQAENWRQQKVWRGQADSDATDVPSRNANPTDERIGDEELHDQQRQEVIDRYHEPQVMPGDQREHDGMTDDRTLTQHLAALYSHAKSEAAFLDQFEGEDGYEDGYRAYRQSVDERLEHLRDLWGQHGDGGDLDEAAKAFETDYDQSTQTGESLLVSEGQVPEQDPELAQANQGDKCCGKPKRAKLLSQEIMAKFHKTMESAVWWKLRETMLMMVERGYPVPVEWMRKAGIRV